MYTRGEGGGLDHILYCICSDLLLELLPLKGAIRKKKYTQ